MGLQSTADAPSRTHPDDHYRHLRSSRRVSQLRPACRAPRLPPPPNSRPKPAPKKCESRAVAPLFACLASEIHYTAALTGSRMPGGRLDAPLLLALDEVTQICPVPVPSWLADPGGKGIQITTVAHGEAQLRSRRGTGG